MIGCAAGGCRCCCAGSCAPQRSMPRSHFSDCVFWAVVVRADGGGSKCGWLVKDIESRVTEWNAQGLVLVLGFQLEAGSVVWQCHGLHNHATHAMSMDVLIVSDNNALLFSHACTVMTWQRGCVAVHSTKGRSLTLMLSGYGEAGMAQGAGFYAESLCSMVSDLLTDG